MRLFVLAALLLAACNPAGQTPRVTEPPQGAIVATGEAPEWKLVADPAMGAMELKMASGETFPAPYLPPERTAGGFEIRGGDVHLALTPGECRLGNVVFTMRATVTPQGGAALSGCAVERWDAQLQTLMPQIDACVAASPNTRYVGYAGATSNSTIVRLGGEGANVDCTVRNGNATIAPRDGTLHFASEGDAIFVRGPGENPGGECYDAPEVHGANGELLGWMVDPLGC